MHREDLPSVDVLVTARPAAAQAENRLVFESLEGLWARVRAKA
jgi:RNase P protein component